MIRVGIAGAAGYTAGELIRVLISHPQVELRYLQSESHRGEPVGRVHRDLIYTNLKISDLDLTGIDVLFLCMGHGMSAQFLERHPVPASVRIIDLSHDFRLKSNAGDFVYGLPELNRERIQGAWHVANPGNRIGVATVGEEWFAACPRVGLRDYRGDGCGTETDGRDAL